MIYEQNCRACDGDLVLVREICRVVFWCIGCGFRTELAELIKSNQSLKKDSRSTGPIAEDPVSLGIQIRTPIIDRDGVSAMTG